MHYFVGQHLPADKLIGSAISPNALQNGKCRFYVEKRVIRVAWGFRKLFLSVKHVDDTPKNQTATTTSTVMHMNRTASHENFIDWNAQFHPMKRTLSSYETLSFILRNTPFQALKLYGQPYLTNHTLIRDKRATSKFNNVYRVGGNLVYISYRQRGIITKI